MNRVLRSLALVLALAVVIGVTPASAAVTIYSSLPISPTNPSLADAIPVESQFLSALGSHGTETYDSYGASFGPSQSLTFGATGITGVAQFSGIQSTAAFGLAVSPPNALVDQPGVGPGSPSQSVGPLDIISFSAPINAFGTYIFQAGDSDPDTLSLLLENSHTGFSQVVPVGTVGGGAGFANAFYFGFTTDRSFDKLTIQKSIPNDAANPDGILLDNTTTSGPAPVPEPSTILLMAIGAGGCGLLIRRRR